MIAVSRRDRALATAIVSVGGVVRLARALGLRQPTVSGWTRVPAHHVLQVEAISGISRRKLRPDLYDVPERSTIRPQVALR